MKKIILIIISLLILVGCGKEKEAIKYQLNNKEKLAITLENDKYHFIVGMGFFIYEGDNEKLEFKFINQEECKNITSSENLNLIKERDKGIIYQDDNYHYLYDDSLKVCVLFDSNKLETLEEILDNISIKVIEEESKGE